MESLPQLPAESPHWAFILLVALIIGVAAILAVFSVVQQYLKTKKEIKEQFVVPSDYSEDKPIQSGTTKGGGVSPASLGAATKPTVSTLPRGAFALPEKIQQMEGVEPGELDWQELQQRLEAHPGEFEMRRNV